MAPRMPEIVLCARHLWVSAQQGGVCGRLLSTPDGGGVLHRAALGLALQLRPPGLRPRRRGGGRRALAPPRRLLWPRRGPTWCGQLRAGAAGGERAAGEHAGGPAALPLGVLWREAVDGSLDADRRSNAFASSMHTSGTSSLPFLVSATTSGVFEATPPCVLLALCEWAVNSRFTFSRSPHRILAQRETKIPHGGTLGVCLAAPATRPLV